ncbi:MAG: ABC transporter permease [Hyphomonadaceae bacterium]
MAQSAFSGQAGARVIGALVDLANGVRRWRTSFDLAVQDIDLRYKRSILGPFWISAALIATVLALAYVFADVFQSDFVTYVSYIGTGLLAWQLIVALVNEGAGSVTDHAGFLKNVPMPLSVIAGHVVWRNAIVFVHNLVAIFVVLLSFGAQFGIQVLLVAPGAAIILTFGYFVALALGPICTRFRDIPLVIQSIMQVLFFLTPIFWMPSAVSHRPMFVAGNPFAHLIALVREPMLGNYPTVLNWQVGLWCCATAAIAALAVVSATRRRITLWL